MKKIFFVLFIVNLYSTIAYNQNNNTISYSLQLKEMKLSDGETGSHTNPFNYVERYINDDESDYIVNSYMRAVFSKNSKELLYSFSDEPEYDKFIKKGDTIYYNNIEFDIKMKPYLSVSSDFDFEFIETDMYDEDWTLVGVHRETKSINLKSNFAGLKFRESWEFDINRGVFSKDIKSVIPQALKFDEDSQRIIRITLCYFKASNNKCDRILLKDFIYTVTINYNDEYEDLIGLNIQQRSNLINNILESAKNKKIKAFLLGENNTLGNELLDYGSIVNHLSMNPESVIIDSIKTIRFYEDWYIDEKSFTIKKKTKAIAIKDVYFDLN